VHFLLFAWVETTSCSDYWPRKETFRTMVRRVSARSILRTGRDPELLRVLSEKEPSSKSVPDSSQSGA
jgi:hypothetical protein